MKKDVNPLRNLSEDTKRKLIDEVLRAVKRQMADLIANSNQKEICEFIKGSAFGERMLSESEIKEITGEEENKEMRDAIYDVKVNATAMKLKAKSRAELYEAFSEADEKIYKEIMEE
jgi:hypothetical protein